VGLLLWKCRSGRKGGHIVNTATRIPETVRYTVELITHRATGKTYVVLGEAATAQDGTYLGYDIYQSAGPLDEHEKRAIRRNPIGWRPNSRLNVDRLMQTFHEYSLETVLVPLGSLTAGEASPYYARPGDESTSRSAEAATARSARRNRAQRPAAGTQRQHGR